MFREKVAGDLLIQAYLSNDWSKYEKLQTRAILKLYRTKNAIFEDQTSLSFSVILPLTLKRNIANITFLKYGAGLTSVGGKRW